MLRCLLSIVFKKKIEQNINFIAHFFTMKGFYKYTYEISLISPIEKNIIFCNMDFSCEFWVWIRIYCNYFEILGFDGKVVRVQLIGGIFDNYEEISFSLDYIVETLNIHKVSNFELNNLIFVQDVTKCALGAYQPPGPPFSKIFYIWSYLPPLYRPCWFWI